MINASPRPLPRSAMTPTPRGRLGKRAFRDQPAHALRKAAQADLPVTQWPGRIAAGAHPLLHARDELLVLNAHAAVDAPVEVAHGMHLAAAVRVYVGDLADH